MKTYKEIINEFKKFADNHTQINQYHYGKYTYLVSDVYKLMNINTITSSSIDNITDFAFEISIFDLLEQDESNFLDAINGNILIINDLINYFYEYVLDQSNIEIKSNRTDNNLVETKATIRIEVDNLNICKEFKISPTAEEYGDRYTGDMKMLCKPNIENGKAPYTIKLTPPLSLNIKPATSWNINYPLIFDTTPTTIHQKNNTSGTMSGFGFELENKFCTLGTEFRVRAHVKTIGNWRLYAASSHGGYQEGTAEYYNNFEGDIDIILVVTDNYTTHDDYILELGGYSSTLGSEIWITDLVITDTFEDYRRFIGDYEFEVSDSSGKILKAPVKVKAPELKLEYNYISAYPKPDGTPGEFSDGSNMRITLYKLQHKDIYINWGDGTFEKHSAGGNTSGTANINYLHKYDDPSKKYYIDFWGDGFAGIYQYNAQMIDIDIDYFKRTPELTKIRNLQMMAGGLNGYIDEIPDVVFSELDIFYCASQTTLFGDISKIKNCYRTNWYSYSNIASEDPDYGTSARAGVGAYGDFGTFMKGRIKNGLYWKYYPYFQYFTFEYKDRIDDYIYISGYLYLYLPRNINVDEFVYLVLDLDKWLDRSKPKNVFYFRGFPDPSTASGTLPQQYLVAKQNLIDDGYVLSYWP
jgi:hypothetical protein